MTVISYLNIMVHIFIVRDLTFSRVLKVFIVFLSHHKLFVKMPYHHVAGIFTFFDHINNKILNCIFVQVCLTRLTKLTINTCKFTVITTSNTFLIYFYSSLLDFSFYYLLALKYWINDKL